MVLQQDRIYTFYELVQVNDDLHLGFAEGSSCFLKPTLDHFQKVEVFDVCSGIGGFALGSQSLGFDTRLFLECNALACEQLRANFSVPVIHGSVDDIQHIQDAHSMRSTGFLQVTGGFPCQPYSCQGDLQGLRDARGLVLPSILRCSWLWQADAILLDCVDNVTQFIEVQLLLEAFANMANMFLSRLVFDLRDQWPVRRRRFWCLLMTKDVPELSLQVWPQCPIYKTLGEILPFDAIWPLEQELELLWDQQEMNIYFDIAYGHDLRTLLPHHQAPTMLHSWANVLRACPCGCRLWPMSMQRLLQGGARGFGIMSALLSHMRHMHPEEGALLCTMPLNYHFTCSPRSALCLLGRIAAPLQVHWLQAQLMAHLQEHFWLHTELQSMMQVAQFKQALLLQRLQRWTLASMSSPRTLQLQMEDTITNVKVVTPMTAGELAHVETALIGSGHYVIVLLHGQRLPPWAQLHEGVTYQLQVIMKKQIRGNGVPTQIVTNDERLASNMVNPTGLGDTQGTHVWAGMQRVLDFVPAADSQHRPLILYPFQARHLLRRSVHPAVQEDWKLRYQKSNGEVMIIYEHDGHWTFLAFQNADSPTWTYYDGLSFDLLDRLWIANQVTSLLTEYLDLPNGFCRFAQLFPQRHQHTCGTIALQHMAFCLGVSSQLPLSELQLHEQFLLRDVPLPEVVADGKQTFNDPLAILLASKGVPDQSVQERAQMVRDKLGVAQIQQILTSSNPWASLKAAASKPGRMFRLITEDEQKEYVNQRAKTKHGAKLSNVKQKKQALQLRQQPTQLDPDHFQLDSQHFQDADGNPVKQILFQDVETDQAGIALCTTNLAKHFLENPKSISMHGLALLLTDNPPQSVITAAGLTPMVFPALCTCTDEHTIIMGHVMQLGDSVVTRKMAGKESEPDKIETQVVKLQVYHDQLEMDWLSFSQSPVRHIINMMDAMKLCKGQNCGIDCPKHHPGLDENLDGVILQVWSRSFLNDMDKKVEPAQATAFTVFLRLPESALHKILTTAPLGLYVEPRGRQPREQDEKYSVVWLPGASFAEAQHQCRTYAKSICLVRLKHKYGIRVRKADEASAWATLRPGADFVEMSIQKIYELFPLPHGTQRQAIAQILQDWSWKARALQPGKGNLHHMAWRVGSSEPPPAAIMAAFGSDVIISAVKDLKVPEHKPTIYASAKTQKQLRESPSGSSAAKTAPATDPWLETDPWAGYTKKPVTATQASSSRREEIHEQIRSEVRSAFNEAISKKKDVIMEEGENDYTTENELRLVALESGMTELQQQNTKFMQWFQHTEDRLQQQEGLMQEVQEAVKTHAGALHTMNNLVQNTEKSIGEVHNTLNVHQQELHSISRPPRKP